MSPTRILVVDDDAAARAGLRMMLEGEEDFVIVGEASGGLDCVRQVELLGPDVVLMDVSMPVVGGIEATRLIVARDCNLNVILLTVYCDSESVLEAFHSGAVGFLLKSSGVELLALSIRTVAAGGGVIDATSMRQVLEDSSPWRPLGGAMTEALGSLTPRESEVFALVAKGMTNEQIAAKLSLEESTVKTHVSNLLRKLQLKDRVQVVLLSQRLGSSREVPAGNPPAIGSRFNALRGRRREPGRSSEPTPIVQWEDQSPGG